MTPTTTAIAIISAMVRKILFVRVMGCSFISSPSAQARSEVAARRSDRCRSALPCVQAKSGNWPIRAKRESMHIGHRGTLFIHVPNTQVRQVILLCQVDGQLIALDHLLHALILGIVFASQLVEVLERIIQRRCVRCV